jgi:hypothetical protein
MITILIDYLSEAFTRGILHEQRKVQHLVQLDQSLLTRIPQQQVPSFSHHSSRMRSEQMSRLLELPIPMRVHAVYLLHATTPGLQRPKISGCSPSDGFLGSGIRALRHRSTTPLYHLHPTLSWNREVGQSHCTRSHSTPILRTTAGQIFWSNPMASRSITNVGEK